MIIKRSIVLTYMLAILISHISVAGAQELTVSAAMSLRGAFEEIGRKFEAGNPGVKVTLNFSSSGKLRQQIEGGAPVDVFASASQFHMNALSAKGLVVDESRVDFAGNNIVLARPKDNPSVKDFLSLNDTAVKRIAIGNPETSPAGTYSREVLMQLGLWEDVRPKLIYVETVRQVLDYLVRGEVDAGIFYASDALLGPDEIEVAAIAPPGSHAPIRYPIAQIKDNSEQKLSGEFIRFVLSFEGRTVLAEKGFRVNNE